MISVTDTKGINSGLDEKIWNAIPGKNIAVRHTKGGMDNKKDDYHFGRSGHNPY